MTVDAARKPLGAGAPKRRRALFTRIWRRKWVYAMFLPAAVWYLAFCYGPLFGTVAAFQKFNFRLGFFASPFVGLQNFKYLFTRDLMFLQAVRNTLEINLLRILFGFAVPIVFALMLNEIRHKRLKSLTQTITYIPHFLSWVILTGIFNSLLVIDMVGTANAGGINVILASLGFQQVNFLLEPSLFRPLLIVTDIWKEFGWNSIIYLAAIAGIDTTLYEAAVIDGASRFQRAWRVTLPCIGGTIAVMLILSVGNVMNTGFEQVYNLLNGALYQTGDILDTYVVRMILQGRVTNYIGIGAAASLFKAVISFAFLVFFNALTRRIYGRGLY